MYSLAIPLAGDDDDNDNDDDGCGSDLPIEPPDSPSAAILAPYQYPPTPHPSLSQLPHATLPVPRRSQTSTILGTVVGIVIAFVALSLVIRHLLRRRHITAGPFKDPTKPRFAALRLRRTTASKKRLSDESWVSPTLPSLSPGSPLSHDLELRRYACTQRKLVPVTTPVSTPTDTDFGSCLEFANGDPGSMIPVPPVRIPSPVYISPFSPSPSLSSSSSISPAPSTEPLISPSPNPIRLSRLLSSTFGNTRVAMSPARPTTAHLTQIARSYAHAYRPSSTTTASLYSPPTPSARLTSTRSRTSFYSGQTEDTRFAWERVRDTFSTVTTSDTDTACTVPHLHRAVAQVQPSTFADPSTQGQARTETLVGTPFGLKLRLSDAGEHARYRLRERQRQREKERRPSATMCGAHQSLEVEAEEARREFKMRDSESVLREIGW